MHNFFTILEKKLEVCKNFFYFLVQPCLPMFMSKECVEANKAIYQ